LTHDFFYELISRDCPFVTWEKNAGRKELYQIPDTDFIHKTTLNSKKYLFFEISKKTGLNQQKSTLPERIDVTGL
jgi:hypothetical protein